VVAPVAEVIAAVGVVAPVVEVMVVALVV